LRTCQYSEFDLFLSRLNVDRRAELLARLHEAQGGDCFICEQPIDLTVQAGSLDIDHVEPLHAGGKDDETNFAITHDSCNRSKQASDLRVARVLARFASIQEAVRASHGRGANLSDILGEYGGAQHTLRFRIEGNEFIYGQGEEGDTTVRTVPLWIDHLSDLRYFFAVLPIGYLHHDDRINPRNIGSNLSKLLTEFHRGRPQLHVSLAWIVSADGADTIKVFDGQHKATAQVLLGVRALPVRVFVDPDPDLLLVANTNAGTTLRQVAFDKSVQRRLGSSLFALAAAAPMSTTSPVCRYGSITGYRRLSSAASRRATSGGPSGRPATRRRVPPCSRRRST
jgi:HNH endonuclease